MRLAAGATITTPAMRVRPRLFQIAGAAIAVGLSVRLVFANTSSVIGDYRMDAKPAIDALSRLDWTGFVHSVPLMGSFSLIVRAPVVALVHALGGGQSLGYTMGALMCVLPLAALVLWLLAEMGRRQQPLRNRLGIAALFAFTPFTGAAITWGHPEEMLTVTFCVVAALAAFRGHGGWSGVALGLAIATKQWALVAAVPVLLAAPSGRLRLGLTAFGVVAALTMPAALADTQTFAGGAKALANANSWVSVVSLWWPFSDFHTRFVTDGVTSVAFTTFKLPASLNMIPHALIVAIGAPIGGLMLARRRAMTLDRVLSFLALMLLLRCVLDPWNNLYYQVPLMIGIYARDALCSRGLPLASAFATVLGWTTFWHIAAPGRGVLTFSFYVAWTLALGVWLVMNAFELRMPSLLYARMPSPRATSAQAA